MSQENNIDAIIFDMSGTLRMTIHHTEEQKLAGITKITALLSSREPPQEVLNKLSKRSDDYREWTDETLVALNVEELWTKWMLPDWPDIEFVKKHAQQLNQLWRRALGTPRIKDETGEVLIELFRRGYRLAVVSNTTSSSEAPDALSDLKLSGCVEEVILSCEFGRRKPDPAMLLEAAVRMDIPPGSCVYVGNSPHRDMISAKRAGFARSILVINPDLPVYVSENTDMIPDHTIHNLKELLDLFPLKKKNSHPARLVNASLSTMWSIGNFPRLDDFFLAAKRLGFASLELNHQITPGMLAEIETDPYPFSSVHEPCPAELSTGEMTARDLLISSLDEKRRAVGVEAIKRSIDLAERLDAHVVVIHSGMVVTDNTMEKQMRALYKSGKRDTEEYLKLLTRIARERSAIAASHVESVKRSLGELLMYARPLKIRLGLENRYHYFDIPLQDEMAELLGLAGPDELGFICDIGHAQALDRLGLQPLVGWLERFSSRIIGTHLHDVIGIDDHNPPGKGEVDFEQFARYLPAAAFRTFEVSPRGKSLEIRTGIKFLLEKGILQPL
jgi:FMN phosphatase YigB (HAD superfamily)/sugar phosphate isomerase/epimerase